MPVPLNVRDDKSTGGLGGYVWFVGQVLSLWAFVEYGGGSFWNIRDETTNNTAGVDCVLVALAIRVVSQIWWGVHLRPYALPASMALPIVLLNFFLDAFVLHLVKHDPDPVTADTIWDSPWFVLGCGMVVMGTLLERIPELQRTLWKAKPENEGKCHKGGLFYFARHINYTGYAMWRLGLFLFTRRIELFTIPIALCLSFKREMVWQHARNTVKYGKVYTDYAEHTKKMVPGIY